MRFQSREDQYGLGLTRWRKRRGAAQQLIALLNGLAHNHHELDSMVAPYKLQIYLAVTPGSWYANYCELMGWLSEAGRIVLRLALRSAARWVGGRIELRTREH